MIQVRPRTERLATVPVVPVSPTPEIAVAPELVVTHGTPLLVLFGSNLGTAAELAQQIGHDGTVRGFATTVASLDDYTDNLPPAGAAVIVSASYNGTPPDNAAGFCRWLGGDLAPSALAGVRYTVFGCGNRDWASTYQAIPTLIDTELAAHGATRVHPRGEGDARDDFDGQFRAWYGTLWSDLAHTLDLPTVDTDGQLARGHRYEVDVLTAAAAPLAATYNATTFGIIENRALQRRDGTTPPARSTRHIGLSLPDGLTYRTGDYLGVVPRNPPTWCNGCAPGSSSRTTPACGFGATSRPNRTYPSTNRFRSSHS